MPRTSLLVTPVIENAPNATTVVLEKGDPLSGHKFVSNGRDLLIIYNHDASSMWNVQVLSTKDPYERLGDINLEILPRALVIVGPLPSLGWRQNDGYIYCTAADTEIYFGVLAL